MTLNSNLVKKLERNLISHKNYKQAKFKLPSVTHVVPS